MTDNATAARDRREAAPEAPDAQAAGVATQDRADVGPESSGAQAARASSTAGAQDEPQAPEAVGGQDDSDAPGARDADEGEAAGARGARLRGLRRAAGRVAHGRLTAAALAVGTVVVTALSGWLCVEVYEQRVETQRQQDILAAARQSALNFTSLDYRHYERDSANVLKGATGDFKEQFTAQTAELTKLVAANKSVSQGQVLEAGIARADERSARVLVVADSKVTNTAAPEGQARTYRLQLDLVLESGRWLTSNVEFVG
ncbi:hypothetical protein ACWD0A_20870 [Streptomyces sp. NPDC002867]